MLWCEPIGRRPRGRAKGRFTGVVKEDMKEVGQSRGCKMTELDGR